MLEGPSLVAQPTFQGQESWWAVVLLPMEGQLAAEESRVSILAPQTTT